MALAQFLHESDGLRAKEEYKCKDTGCPNDYKTPGCDAPGQSYYGRGYIQLTWCKNYKAASQELYKDARLVTDPKSVASNENYSWDTAFWFWKVISFLLEQCIPTRNYALTCRLTCMVSQVFPRANSVQRQKQLMEHLNATKRKDSRSQKYDMCCMEKYEVVSVFLALELREVAISVIILTQLALIYSEK